MFKTIVKENCELLPRSFRHCRGNYGIVRRGKCNVFLRICYVRMRLFNFRIYLFFDGNVNEHNLHKNVLCSRYPTPMISTNIITKLLGQKSKAERLRTTKQHKFIALSSGKCSKMFKEYDWDKSFVFIA